MTKKGFDWQARTARRTGVVLAWVCVIGLLAGGCTSNDPAPNTVRNSAQTAPADLQLICANAAATSLGVDGGSVLPISSSQIDAQRYQVELDARGARATCVVDAAGTVLSVQKA